MESQFEVVVKCLKRQEFFYDTLLMLASNLSDNQRHAVKVQAIDVKQVLKKCGVKISDVLEVK